jgi:hypothetical protein
MIDRSLVERSNREKERTTELKFKQWLDSNEIPYWYIQQDVDTYSKALKRFMTKRPDFLILIPHVGFILTDVEYKNPLEKHEEFPIDYEETEQYFNSQKYFNLQVWYVLSNEKYSFNTWFWIPAGKVLEKGQKHVSPKSNTEYLAVPIAEFIQMAKTDNLGRLFSEISKY